MVHGAGKVEVRSSPTLLSYEQCIARAAAVAAADVGRASHGAIIRGVGLTHGDVIKGCNYSSLRVEPRLLAFGPLQPPKRCHALRFVPIEPIVETVLQSLRVASLRRWVS